MKVLVSIATLIFVAINTGNAAAQHGDYVEPKVLTVPDIVAPEAAVKSGLGGTVEVLVSVDTDGSVTAINDVIGPNGTCPQVERADVLALRAVSKEAAIRTKFTPATVGGTARRSSTWLKFDFPRLEMKNDPMVAGHDDSVPKHPVNNETNSRSKKSTVFLKGKPLSLPKAHYPATARPFRAEGQVAVTVFVDERGEVFSADAVSGHPRLRPAARLAACKARFSPTTINGMPIKASAIVTYNFVP